MTRSPWQKTQAAYIVSMSSVISDSHKQMPMQISIQLSSKEARQELQGMRNPTPLKTLYLRSTRGACCHDGSVGVG